MKKKRKKKNKAIKKIIIICVLLFTVCKIISLAPNYLKDPNEGQTKIIINNQDKTRRTYWRYNNTR